MSQILSRDSVTIAVDAAVFYRVWNPDYAIANIADFRFRLSLKKWTFSL